MFANNQIVCMPYLRLNGSCAYFIRKLPQLKFKILAVVLWYRDSVRVNSILGQLDGFMLGQVSLL